MNKRIIYPNGDGRVAIIIPAPEARRQVLVSEAQYESVVVPATDTEPEREDLRLIKEATYRQETDEEFADWVAAKHVPPVVRYEGTGIFEEDESTGERYEVQREIKEPRPFKIIDASDVPTDRTFRNAWEFAA
jgi:hypothetical protein